MIENRLMPPGSLVCKLCELELDNLEEPLGHLQLHYNATSDQRVVNQREWQVEEQEEWRASCQRKAKALTQKKKRQLAHRVQPPRKPQNSSRLH